MKNTFFEKNKKAFGIAACIFVFALITLVYFNPILEGKRLKQHDNEMYKGMSKEIVDYREATGEQTLWTNSMFGGMPAWNISVSRKTNLFFNVHQLLKIGLPDPIGAVFISMLGFFILLLVLECGIGTSLLGALAFGFTSYMYIIIGAGHNTKAFAIAYMAPVIAGILLTYKGKYLYGSLLTAFALSLEIIVNHLQITYYLLILCLILIAAQFISDLKEKQLGSFLKASASLLVAVVFAILTNSTLLYANYEFGKETTRGKPILASNSENQSKGLDRDYITQWSYGIGETWNLMIPNAKGGASSYIGNQNPALEKADPRYRQSIAQSNAYWGDQPGTSGPVYVGAIVVFLFVLGALTVKGKLKWALIAATLLSILLSWGKNFMGLTDFFINYIPGYNKFRAVSMTLVIAEITLPLLGILGIAEIIKNPDKKQRKIWIASGITTGICLLFFLAPRAFFSFLSQAESQQFATLMTGQDGTLYKEFAEQLENVRIAIFRKDAIRSFLFIILATIPILLFAKGKLKTTPAIGILSLLVVIDMFPVDKRFLNDNSFEPKAKQNKPFTATTADGFILADETPYFRVLNLTKDVFNDASTSYFHKSIGGYHGAKLRRYQDIINGYLNPEIKQFGALFKTVDSELTLRLAMEQQRALNMLNTKYIIYNPESEPIENPCAFGNAWFVDNIRWVETPNEEFDAISTTSLRHTAILHKEFQPQIGSFETGDSRNGNIVLTEYKPNKLTYSFTSDQDQLVVFSEIWSDMGWKLYLDNKEHPLLRANYVLRCALIPCGDHQIVMEYTPRIWTIGNCIQLVVSLLILLSVFAVLVITLRKKVK